MSDKNTVVATLASQVDNLEAALEKIDFMNTTSHAVLRNQIMDVCSQFDLGMKVIDVDELAKKEEVVNVAVDLETASIAYMEPY